MKLQTFSRNLTVSTATVNAGLTLATVVTTGNHLLATGDIIGFHPHTGKKYSVTVTNATTFTFVPDTSAPNPAQIPSELYTSYLNTQGQNSIVISNSNTADVTKTIQSIGSTTSGTGSALVTIQVSNNGTDWLTYGTLTLTLSTANATDGIVMTAPWQYIRASATTLSGTGAKVTTIMASA